MTTYIHKTQQRLRVRSEFILRNPERVTTLIAQLEQIEAITSVNHKCYAGSVAITFDPKAISTEDLLETLASHGWLESHQHDNFIENAIKSGSRALVKGIASAALRRLMGPILVKALPI